ncbi:MAG TPA: YlzJ-like family protein [Virgibacillus sp.]|nr:YlzJ-like family protein [Virgibacillus sp.]
MIMYTPLSETDVFPHEQDEQMARRHFISHGGKMMYVEQTEDGSYELLQLMSTDPQDFLNENYTPGSIIS